MFFPKKCLKFTKLGEEPVLGPRLGRLRCEACDFASSSLVVLRLCRLPCGAAKLMDSDPVQKLGTIKLLSKRLSRRMWGAALPRPYSVFIRAAPLARTLSVLRPLSRQ